MISSYNTPTYQEKAGNPHGLEALQNMAVYLSQSKEHIYASFGQWKKHPHKKKKNGSILACIWKSSLWFHKVALEYILEYRVGRFALDQEADLCPKGTNLQ